MINERHFEVANCIWHSWYNCSWDFLNHEDSRKQAYVWGEDGLLGISDKFGLLSASIALWNHVDPILKERLFGLNNNEVSTY